jgi:hypothetical protein
MIKIWWLLNFGICDMGHLTWGLYMLCGHLAAITSLSGEETRHIQVLLCVRSQFVCCWETMIMCNYVHECVFCAYLYNILSSKDMFFSLVLASRSVIQPLISNNFCRYTATVYW